MPPLTCTVQYHAVEIGVEWPIELDVVSIVTIEGRLDEEVVVEVCLIPPILLLLPTLLLAVAAAKMVCISLIDQTKQLLEHLRPDLGISRRISNQSIDQSINQSIN